MNHRKPQEYSPEQLDALRRHAEELLEATAERVLGNPPRRESEPVEIHFDWEIPSLTEFHVVTFLLDIQRGVHQSNVRFSINLARLERAELEGLRDFLARRHSGQEDGYTFTRNLTWLLTLALRQSGTPPDKVDAIVRELLLFGVANA